MTDLSANIYEVSTGSTGKYYFLLGCFSVLLYAQNGRVFDPPRPIRSRWGTRWHFDFDDDRRKRRLHMSSRPLDCIIDMRKIHGWTNKFNACFVVILWKKKGACCTWDVYGEPFSWRHRQRVYSKRFLYIIINRVYKHGDICPLQFHKRRKGEKKKEENKQFVENINDPEKNQTLHRCVYIKRIYYIGNGNSFEFFFPTRRNNNFKRRCKYNINDFFFFWCTYLKWSRQLLFWRWVMSKFKLFTVILSFMW